MTTLNGFAVSKSFLNDDLKKNSIRKLNYSFNEWESLELLSHGFLKKEPKKKISTL